MSKIVVPDKSFLPPKIIKYNYLRRRHAEVFPKTTHPLLQDVTLIFDVIYISNSIYFFAHNNYDAIFIYNI